jgi:hypothetical protein
MYGTPLPDDLEAVRSLWLDYLTWGNDELDARYGFRLPIQEAVEHDVASIAKFQPPYGRLLLASRTALPSARRACGGSPRTPARSSACGWTRRIGGAA